MVDRRRAHIVNVRSAAPSRPAVPCQAYHQQAAAPCSLFIRASGYAGSGVSAKPGVVGPGITPRRGSRVSDASRPAPAPPTAVPPRGLTPDKVASAITTRRTQPSVVPVGVEASAAQTSSGSAWLPARLARVDLTADTDSPHISRASPLRLSQTPLHWDADRPQTTHTINVVAPLLPAREVLCEVYPKRSPARDGTKQCAPGERSSPESIHSRAHAPC